MSVGAIGCLEAPVADLLADLWQWPGQSETLDLFVGQSLLDALADEAALASEGIAGLLLGRHIVVRDPAGRERHCVLALNYHRAAWGADGSEPRLGRDGDTTTIAANLALRELAIVGWYRSHSGSGVFLAPEQEEVVHRRDFAEPFQVAYILDLELRQAGFFTWEGHELRGEANSCLATFDPLTREVLARRQGHRRKSGYRSQASPAWPLTRGTDGAIAALALAVGLMASLLAWVHRPLTSRPAARSESVRAKIPVPALRVDFSVRGRSQVQLVVRQNKPALLGYWILREGPLPADTLTFLAQGRPVASRSEWARVTDSPVKTGAYRYLVIPEDRAGNLGEPWDSAALGLSEVPRGLWVRP